MAMELPAMVTNRVGKEGTMVTIKLAARWDGTPKSLTHPEHGWIRFLEIRNIAHATYLDEPPGWRIVVCDERRFTQLIPILQKYGVYGTHTWTYDIHP
jgi:hypothetical protein